MRPKIKRHICEHNSAKFKCFKPNGIPVSKLEKIMLAEDEFEAMRLVDLESLSQQDAALKMQVSRQTFANILKKGRFKVTRSLINGHALILDNTEETK
jgi:predicted DNA-binding protein (UPF0251 family)